MRYHRISKYEIECPKCKQFFAWFHECPENKGLVPIRGVGEDQMKIIRWDDSYKKNKWNQEDPNKILLDLTNKSTQ